MVGKRKGNIDNTGTTPGNVDSVTGKTALGRDGLTCTGNICFTSDGGIVVDLTKSECSPSAVREVTQRTLKGADVSFKVGNTMLTDEDFDDIDAEMIWLEERQKALKKLKSAEATKK